MNVRQSLKINTSDLNHLDGREGEGIELLACIPLCNTHLLCRNTLFRPQHLY